MYNFPDRSVGKESACNAGDPSSIPRSGRSTGEGIGYPTPVFLGFPGGSAGKSSACSVGDLVLIPRLGRSPGKGRSPDLKDLCKLGKVFQAEETKGLKLRIEKEQNRFKRGEF